MRIMLCLCGAAALGAALILVPMHPRLHNGGASEGVTSSAGAGGGAVSAVSADSSASSRATAAPDKGPFLGFDRNIYPGDDAMPILRKTFAYAGFWVGPPPGEKINTWKGKRELMKSLEDTVWNLPTGSVTAPIKIATGFEILKVDDHTKAGLAPLAEVKNEIENMLYGPKMQPKVREYLTQLRKQAFLQIKAGYVDTGAAPGQNTTWQDPAQLKPQTVTKAEVEQKTRHKRLLWLIPIPGTEETVTGKSSSR